MNTYTPRSGNGTFVSWSNQVNSARRGGAALGAVAMLLLVLGIKWGIQKWDEKK